MSAPRAEPAPVAPGWALPLLIAPLFAFQVYAFHWGVVMPDTLAQWAQAVSGSYDDWHPPATTWLWRQLMRLGPGPAPMLLFQDALYWTGTWLIAEAMRRRGRAHAMAGALAMAALPIPLGQLGAVLKDPLLAACCLTALGLALASDGAGRKLRGAAAAAAFALLVFASAVRFNAVFATAPLLVAWLPPSWTGRTWRAAAALVGSAVLLACMGYCIDSVLLHPRPARPILSLVNFDLAGIVAHGGAGAYPGLDRETERRMVARCYDPSLFNRTYREDCDGLEDALAGYADAHRLSAPAIWLGAVERAPLAYARHRIAHYNRNVRFLVADVPPDAVYLMATLPNPFGLSFHPNWATWLVYRTASAMALSPFGRPATWLAVAAGLLTLARGLAAGRMVAAAAGSALLYGLGYAVVSVAPDLRYNLWTMLAALTALILAAADPALRRLSRRRLLLAAAPAAVACAAEIAALTLG